MKAADIWDNRFVILPTGTTIHHLGSRNKGTDEWVRIPKVYIGQNGFRWEGTEEEYVALMKQYNAATRINFIADVLQREGP